MYTPKNQPQIRNELINIYLNSVKNNHGDIELTRIIWETHESMVCNEHGFNFEYAYKKHANIVKVMTEKKLFNTLRINTFSSIRKAKHELILFEFTKKSDDKLRLSNKTKTSEHYHKEDPTGDVTEPHLLQNMTKQQIM